MVAKILISLPQEFLDNVDSAAAEEHRSRSELIREALRAYLETRQEKKANAKQIQEDRAAYQAETRAGESLPKGYTVSAEALTDFERSKRLLEERAERFKVIDRIRSRQPDVPPEELEKDVAEAIKAVREQRRVQGRH